jgi:hypothetical protein
MRPCEEFVAKCAFASHADARNDGGTRLALPRNAQKLADNAGLDENCLEIATKHISLFRRLVMRAERSSQRKGPQRFSRRNPPL